MGLLSYLADLGRSATLMLRPRYGQRRAFGAFAGTGGPLGPFVNSWTDSRYEMVRHFRHWVYVAVDRVCTSFAMHAPNVSAACDGSERPRPGSRRLPPLPRWKSERALTPLLAHERLEPVPYYHPLQRLLRDPNDPDTSFDLWYETVMYLLLTGNSYWWAPPHPVTRLPAALWCLPAHWVYPRTDRDGATTAYELHPVEGGYRYFTIPASDVIHFRKKSPVSKADGYAPLTAGSQWVDTQESMDKTRWWSFRNGIFPGVSVEFDPGVKLPQEDDLNRIEARLMARYGGEQNANKPIFVPPGAKLRKMYLSPDELMFCQSEEQLRDQILALYGVPAAVAQVATQQSYGAMLASQAGFYAQTLNPLYRFFGMHLTEKLAPRYDRSLRVWWEDRSPQDPELIERQLNTDLAYCARTPNEVRQMRGQEPYPFAWADEPLVPLNTVPISVALERSKRYKSEVNTPDQGGSPGTNPATATDPGNTPRGGEAPDVR